MSGTVIKRVSRNRHFCSPPGWRERRRLDLDFGSVWECECGQRWEWAAHWGDPAWSSVVSETTPNPKETQ